MKLSFNAHSSLKLIGGLRIAAAAALGLVLCFSLVRPAHAADAGFSFQPLGGTYNIGDTLTVDVHENSGTDPTNAVAVSFAYPKDLLEYVAGDTSDSPFIVTAVEDGGDGTVTFHRGSTTPLTGDQLVEKAIFKVIGSGTAVLNFDSSSVAVSSRDNRTNVAPNRGNASFTLNASTPSPTPGPTPGPTPNPTPTPTPAPHPTPSPTPSPRPVTRITPSTSGSNSSSNTSIPLDNGDAIQLEVPASIEPATIQSDGISKVEYYLNGKLVKTVAIPPYTYKLQTDQLLNGKYTLTTKTFYTNGQTNSTTQTIIVKNPFGMTQFRLLMQKYILLVILLILLVVALVIVLIIRRSARGGGIGGGDVGYDPSYDTGYLPPASGSAGPPTIVGPTAPGA